MEERKKEFDEADLAIMNQSYVRKELGADEEVIKTGEGLELVKDEVPGVLSRIFGDGCANKTEIRPFASVKEIVDSEGRRVKIPYVGISGTF